MFSPRAVDRVRHDKRPVRRLTVCCREFQREGGLADKASVDVDREIVGDLHVLLDSDGEVDALGRVVTYDCLDDRADLEPVQGHRDVELSPPATSRRSVKL